MTPAFLPKQTTALSKVNIAANLVMSLVRAFQELYGGPLQSAVTETFGHCREGMDHRNSGVCSLTRSTNRSVKTGDWCITKAKGTGRCLRTHPSTVTAGLLPLGPDPVRLDPPRLETASRPRLRTEPSLASVANPGFLRLARGRDYFQTAPDSQVANSV